MDINDAGTMLGLMDNHLHGHQTTHQLEVRPLNKQDEPVAKQFREWVTTNCKTARVYTFAMTHPLTLTYMVIFGGILQEWQNYLMLSLFSPPLLFMALVHMRVRIMQQSKLDTFDLRPYYTGSRRMYVAVENNNIVATMACDRKDCDTAVVRHMCVHAKYHCKDIAQKLMDSTLRFCKEEKYQKVWFQFTNLQVHAFGSGLCRNNGFKWLKDETLLTILPGVSLRWQHFVLDVTRSFKVS